MEQSPPRDTSDQAPRDQQAAQPAFDRRAVAPRRRYAEPRLHDYGTVASLTRVAPSI